MATQDDIINLTHEIAEEQQSAAIIEKQISDEQLRSSHLIDGWQQQARRHHDAANRMEQSLQAKRHQLEQEQQHARQSSDNDHRTAERIARGLL
ncbi:MAG: hypothetical protein ABIR91_00110 [Candidatus Saccharimonadales bacterium]